MQKEFFYTHVHIDMYKAGKQAERLGWFLLIWYAYSVSVRSLLVCSQPVLPGHCLPGYLPPNATAICIEFTPCPWAFIDIILSDFQRVNLSYVRQHNIKYIAN